MNADSCVPCPSYYMFRPWASLPINPCLILVAFKIQKYSWHSINRFWNPTHQPTMLRTSVSLGGLLWYVLLRGLECTYDGLYLVSIACIWPKIKDRLDGGTLAAANMQTQMYMNVRRHTQTHECKANCVQCVGGRNLKTHQDVRRLFKDFRDTPYLQVMHSVFMLALHVYLPG